MMKLNKSVALILRTAKGKDKAITNDRIREILLRQFGIKINPKKLRDIIHDIRVNGIVKRLVAGGNGYWIAEYDYEVKEYLISLEGRMNQIRDIHEALKNQ